MAYVVNNPGTVTGSATMQRYLDPTRTGGMDYRHYNAPVGGSTVTDLATTGFAPVVNPAYNCDGQLGDAFPKHVWLRRKACERKHGQQFAFVCSEIQYRFLLAHGHHRCTGGYPRPYREYFGHSQN